MDQIGNEVAASPAFSSVLTATASIVAAHVSRNQVRDEQLPALIREVHAALTGLSAPQSEVTIGRPEPAVPVKKSVFPDFIICLEDGKKLKMLKRHLSASFGMTPEAYRARWELPASYPMVAENYAKKRSALAKKIGLGTGRRRITENEPAPASAATVATRKVVGRKAKVGRKAARKAA